MSRNRRITLSLRAWYSRVLLLTVASGLAACATTSSTSSVTATVAAPESSSRTEVEEAVGFTIVEEGSVTTDVRNRYTEALQRLESGDHEAGVALLEEITSEAPHLCAPCVDLGIEQRRAGDREAAEASLMRAIEAAPEHPVAHNELGIVYRKLGRFDEARRHYEIALEIYPGYHFARRNLAVLCDLYIGDLGCALENYEAYMGMVPDDPEASMWVADLRLRLDQGE